MFRKLELHRNFGCNRRELKVLFFQTIFENYIESQHKCLLQTNGHVDPTTITTLKLPPHNFPSFFSTAKDLATICGGKAISGRLLQSMAASRSDVFFCGEKIGAPGHTPGIFNWPCWDQSDFSDVSVWYGVLDGFWVSSNQDRWLHLL